MSADSDFEPALDVDTGHEAADMVGGGGNDGPVEVREIVRDRGVKDTTRKLFADAAKKLKPQLDAAGDPFDDLEPAIAHEPSEAAAGASASTHDASKAPPPPAAAAPTDPAAAAVDSRAAAQLELREKTLKDREAELEKRDQALAAREKWREQYHEAPGRTLMSLVKEVTGLDGDELKDELSDIITELSSEGLGLAVPEQHKQRVESRRAVRTVKAYKAEVAKKEAELAKKQEAAAQQQREAGVVQTLGGLLGQQKDRFPHLAAEEGAAELVWDMIKTKFNRDGVEPPWEEMAQLANDHFKKKYDDWYAKRRHLFAPAAPSQAPVAASAPQGDPQSRRSSTLTNKTAAPVQPAPSSDEGDYDRDAHRRRSLSSLKERLKETAAE